MRAKDRTDFWENSNVFPSEIWRTSQEKERKMKRKREKVSEKQKERKRDICD